MRRSRLSKKLKSYPKKTSSSFSYPLDKENWVTGAKIPRYREYLLDLQGGVCPILKEPMLKPCLDHDHYDGKCRGVIGDRVNMFEGRVQKLWAKYLEGSTKITLSEALRNLADYLEKDNSENLLHGQIVMDLKKGLLRRTKENICKLCRENFGIHLDESLTKEDLIKQYLGLFTSTLERDYLYESRTGITNP